MMRTSRYLPALLFRYNVLIASTLIDSTVESLVKHLIEIETRMRILRQELEAYERTVTSPILKEKIGPRDQEIRRLSEELVPMLETSNLYESAGLEATWGQIASKMI
jgi:hypothetical protein